MTPTLPPLGRGARLVAISIALFLLVVLAILALVGCTIRGGICSTDEGCQPAERCKERRCVPSPGGPI